jgi:hypothetical protein
MEAIRSSETSVLIRAKRCHLPEDDNHHSHRRGNLKSYKLIIPSSRYSFRFYASVHIPGITYLSMGDMAAWKVQKGAILTIAMRGLWGNVM